MLVPKDIVKILNFLESGVKQSEATIKDRITMDNFAVRKQADTLITSTPLRGRSQDLGGHNADIVRRSMENVETADKDSNASKVLFSEEAQIILNTTPELSQEDTREVFANEKNLSSNSLMKARFSSEDLMVSQMSLDSARLGQLQENRRVNTASLHSVAEDRSSINDLSLFAELSSEEPSIMTEMESVSCLSPVGKELEGLIKENEELLDSKYIYADFTVVYLLSSFIIVFFIYC